MNYAEKMEMVCRLLGNLADWMVKHGEVLTDRQHSNAFCRMRIREVIWRGSRYDIIEVDGMTCQIEKN